MDLEQRVARLESRVAISELVARYCHGADGRDADLFRSVWHVDAVWDVSPHRFVGRVEIVDAVARQWTVFHSMHHATSNSIVEFDSDSDARGRHDVTSLTALRDGRLVLTTGQYFDRYLRLEGSWVIRERRATVLTSVDLLPAAG